MSDKSAVRIAVLAGSVALVVSTALASLGAQATEQSAARLAVDPVNPVRPVAPGDVQLDPSHGFLVLVEGDAGLYENETEGPMAIGGDLTWRQYQAALNHPGTYVLPGDTAPTGLVIGGAPNYAGSGSGLLQVLNGAYAKVGDLSGSTVVPSGGVTFVVPDGGDTSTRPAIAVNSPQPAASVAGDSGFDFAALFGLYRGINTDMAGCEQTVQLTDQNAQAPWNGTDPVATIGLQPGQNVLNLTPAQMSALDTINPVNGALQPGSEAWLIINVLVDGDYDWDVPNVSWQGNGPSQHVLWNFTTTGTITLGPTTPTVWGTVYAPNALLVDQSSSNIEGAVIARSLIQGGPVSGSGGEIHNAPFADLFVSCQEPVPTTTTTTDLTTTTTTTTDTTTTTTDTTTTTTDTTTTTTDTTTTTTEPTTTTTEPTTTTTEPTTTTTEPTTTTTEPTTTTTEPTTTTTDTTTTTTTTTEPTTTEPTTTTTDTTTTTTDTTTTEPTTTTGATTSTTAQPTITIPTTEPVMPTQPGGPVTGGGGLADTGVSLLAPIIAGGGLLLIGGTALLLLRRRRG